MDIRSDTAASPSISQASMPEVFSITIHPDRQFVWKSSWLERLPLLATPIILLIVFFETTRQQNTEYRRIDDFEFYAPITSIHSSRGIYQLPRVFICGILVLEPQPLINHDELLRQTRLVNPRAYGLTVSSPGELCYPESLISYKGLTMLELTLLQIVLVGLLGLWVLLSGWNMLSFALYHKRGSVMLFIHCHKVALLAPFQGAVAGLFTTGGIATLNHRLTAATPTGVNNTLLTNCRHQRIPRDSENSLKVAGTSLDEKGNQP